MGLRAKFNLAFIAAFAIGLALAAYALQQVFIQNAREQVVQNARIMMTAAIAVRHFTNREVAPLAAALNSPKFIPASVPSFAAQTTFREVQAKFSDYTYREPTLNPTNLADRPADWEADEINAFRNNPDMEELLGERDTPTGRSLNLARPLRIDNPDCLTCHSTPARAPASMISSYGGNNGFGWQLHEVVGAQVVSVPMSLPLRQAYTAFVTFLVILLAMFVVILIVLNILLHYTVIRPVVKVSRMANAVSLGETDVEDYERRGHDEIAVLSASFNRMRRSLDRAMRMLDR